MPTSSTANSGSHASLAATQPKETGSAVRPATAVPPFSAAAGIAVASIALWCQHRIVMALRLITTTGAHSAGRASSAASRALTSTAAPDWAAASASTSRDGGWEFVRASPGTPTMDAG